MSKRTTIFFFVFAGLLSACDDSSPFEAKTQSKLVEPDVHLAMSDKNHSDSRSIATVGDASISVDVLRYYLAQKGFGSNNKKLNAESLGAVLNEVISLELYKQAAIQNELDKDPATVLAMTRILSNKYQTDILTKNSKLVQVSEEEIKARFEGNKQRYTMPSRRRGAIISVRLPRKAGAEERKNAQEKLLAVSGEVTALPKDKMFFGDLAQRYSDDIVSKSRRGDIGWVVEGASINRYEPVVVKTLFSLDEIGAVSTMVKGERGYYLVKLVSLIPMKQQTLKQVKRAIYQQLLSEKRHGAELKIAEALKKQFEVNINDSVMNDFIEKINTRDIAKNNMPPSFPVSIESPKREK